jgi:hypothetical protein
MKHLGWTDWSRFCIWLCMELNLKPEDTPSSFQSLVSPNSYIRCILWLSLFWISPRQVSLYSENSDLPTTTEFRGGVSRLQYVTCMQSDCQPWSWHGAGANVISDICLTICDFNVLWSSCPQSWDTKPHMLFEKVSSNCGYPAQLIYNGETWGVLF